MKVLLEQEHGPNLQALTAFVPTVNVVRVPLSIVEWQLAQPRPDALRRGANQDGILEFHHAIKPLVSTTAAIYTQRRGA